MKENPSLHSSQDESLCSCDLQPMLFLQHHTAAWGRGWEVKVKGSVKENSALK